MADVGFVIFRMPGRRHFEHCPGNQKRVKADAIWLVTVVNGNCNYIDGDENTLGTYLGETMALKDAIREIGRSYEHHASIEAATEEKVAATMRSVKRGHTIYEIEGGGFTHRNDYERPPARGIVIGCLNGNKFQPYRGITLETLSPNGECRLLEYLSIEFNISPKEIEIV